MKIAFIVEPFPSLSQTFILNQITGLIDHGHEVDIYAQVRNEQQKIHADVEKYQLLRRTYYQPNMPHNRILRVLKAIGLFLLYFFKDPVLVLKSLNVFKYGKPAASLSMFYSVIPFLGKRPIYDVIHCHFGLLGRKGSLLKQMGAIDGCLLTGFYGVDVTQNVQLLGADLYADLFSHEEMALPCTDYFRHCLIKLGCPEDKVLTHHLGIDTSTFNFIPRRLEAGERVRLLTISRLTEKKGIEYSIRAVAKVRQKYPNVQFEIIGDGHLKPALQFLIQELQLEDTVHLAGAQSRDEVITALSQAHIFIHPSVTSDNGDQEGSPTAIIEAMAMGLPIVSTYHSGIPEVVQDEISGFLVPERDADALAEKLLHLMQHPESWVEMGQVGRLRIEQQHDINQLNDRLISIYQQCMLSAVHTIRVNPSTG